MSLSDYERIERAIAHLERHYREQPSLDRMASAAGLSPFHFQRLFKRWAGVSPKRFLQFLTVEHAQEALRQGRSALETAYDTGLSGPGRLHDLFVAIDAVTPGEYKSGGLNLSIRYGVHGSPFGDCFLAVTERGICALEFLDDAERAAVQRLRDRWPTAELVPDSTTTAPVAAWIFERSGAGGPITLLIRGTNFQIKVWEALVTLPAGALASYSDIAAIIGRRGADRAVGSAVAHNPVAYLIPCHRVIQRSGVIGSYRWGTARKKALLAWEAARAGAEVAA